jgi:hypothetical protein
MRPRPVPPGNERKGFVFYCSQGGQNVLRSLDARRIALGSNENEIVEHHWVALSTEALCEKFFLSRFGVHEDHIGVATPRGVERLARAQSDHLHVDAGLLLEKRQDVPEEAGVLRGRGGSDDD